MTMKYKRALRVVREHERLTKLVAEVAAETERRRSDPDDILNVVESHELAIREADASVENVRLQACEQRKKLVEDCEATVAALRGQLERDILRVHADEEASLANLEAVAEKHRLAVEAAGTAAEQAKVALDHLAWKHSDLLKQLRPHERDLEAAKARVAEVERLEAERHAAERPPTPKANEVVLRLALSPFAPSLNREPTP